MHGLSGGESDVPLLFAELLNPQHYQFDPVSLWHFGAALVGAACGALVLYWERGSKVSRLFAGFALLFTLWAASRGVTRLLTDPDLVVFVSRRIYILIMLALPLLYQFAMVMLRRDGRRAFWIRFNWVVGMAVALAAVGTPSVIATCTSGATSRCSGSSASCRWSG